MERRLLVFLLLGLTAMAADMVYEGGRSALGPYMEALEAPLVLVGAVSLGDVIGYMIRGASGAAAARLGEKGAWALLVAGYAANIAIPLLALAGRPETALLLIILERAGKGLRAPVKDAFIAGLTEGTRIHGIAYGVHEILDQLGAVAGPLLVAYTLSTSTYEKAFSTLAIPYAASMMFLAAALAFYHRIPGRRAGGHTAGAPWRRIVAVSLPMAGLVHWALAGALLAGQGAASVALAYSVAMLVDVLLAIPYTLAYERYGRIALLALPVSTGLATLTVYHGDPLLTGVLWGTAMAGYETIAKADIASATPGQARFQAFGMLGLLQGVALTAGNTVFALAWNKMNLVATYIVLVEAFTVYLIIQNR